MAIDNDIATEETGRNRKSRRLFVNADGERSPRASTETVGFVLEILDEGEVLESFEYQLDQFSEGVRNAAAVFGIITSVTNTFGSAKMGAQDAAEAAETRLQTFLNGEWSEARQAGVRSADIVEAFVRFRNTHGMPTTEERRSAFEADIKEGRTKVADLLKAEPGLRAHFDAIKAERAAERAERSLAKAGAETGSSLLD